MTESEAIEIANELILKNPSSHYTLHFISIRVSNIHPNHWAIAFEVKTETGGILEGPVFVMVDRISTKAWFFG